MIGIETENGFQQYDGTSVPDTELSSTSTNSVQNKIVTQAINQLNTSVNAIKTSKVYKPSNRAVNVVTDLLNVALGSNDAEVNQPFYFSTDAGALTNIPSGVSSTSAFYGWREVHCVMSLTTVTLHEMYPYYGRTWINTYDTNVNTWYGWRHISTTS